MPNPRSYDRSAPALGELVFRSATDRRFFLIAAVLQVTDGFYPWQVVADAEGAEYTVVRFPEGEGLLAQAQGPTPSRRWPWSRASRHAWVLCRVNRLQYDAQEHVTGIERSRISRRIHNLEP